MAAPSFCFEYSRHIIHCYYRDLVTSKKKKKKNLIPLLVVCAESCNVFVSGFHHGAVVLRETSQLFATYRFSLQPLSFTFRGSLMTLKISLGKAGVLMWMGHDGVLYWVFSPHSLQDVWVDLSCLCVTNL